MVHGHGTTGKTGSQLPQDEKQVVPSKLSFSRTDLISVFWFLICSLGPCVELLAEPFDLLSHFWESFSSRARAYLPSGSFPYVSAISRTTV